MSCQRCGKVATINLGHRGVGLGYACFDCADLLMIDLAHANTAAGGSPEESLSGYMAWRAHAGRPMSRADAIAALHKGDADG